MKHYLATKAAIAAVTVLATVTLGACASSEPVTVPAPIPSCLEDELVAKNGTCVHPDTAEFRHGYWYAS